MKALPRTGSASVSLECGVTRVRCCTAPVGLSRTSSTSWRLWNTGSKRLVYQTPTVRCVFGSVSRNGMTLSARRDGVRARPGLAEVARGGHPDLRLFAELVHDMHSAPLPGR